MYEAPQPTRIQVDDRFSPTLEGRHPQFLCNVPHTEHTLADVITVPAMHKAEAN